MARIAALLGCLCMAACQWLIACYAPLEAAMGPVQKIFYYHLPLAWWGLISFLAVFIGSIMYLWKRALFWDCLCAACAEVGLLLAALSVMTGMIWARRSWGVWWTWDPRLTTALVMCFLYAGYMLIRGLDMPVDRKRVICAVIGIIAFADVPLVFFSARIFRSIHPSVFASEGGGLEPEMKLTALACVAAMGFVWYSLCALRYKQYRVGVNLDNLRQCRMRRLLETEL